MPIAVFRVLSAHPVGNSKRWWAVSGQTGFLDSSLGLAFVMWKYNGLNGGTHRKFKGERDAIIW